MTEGLATAAVTTGATSPDVQFMTTEELAAWLRTTPETCRYWRHVGKEPRSFKVGRKVLYDRADVDAWIALARAKETSGPAA